MKSSLVAGLLALATPFALSAQTPQLKSVRIADVTIVDGTGAAPKPHMTVILRGGRITEIGAPGSAASSADTTVDGAGRYLIESDSLPTLHRELELLVTGAGLTPIQALTAATLNGARAIGIADQTGTIAVGKSADLVLLDADSLIDIRNTRRIGVVFKNGIIVRP